MSEEKTNITFLIKKASLAYEKLANQYLNPFDLTISQYRILLFLYGHPERSSRMVDIENFYSLTHPTTLGLLDYLEKKDFIKRIPNPKDGRSKLITLTKKANDLEARLQSVFSSLDKHLTRNLEYKEQEQLSFLLQKLLSSHSDSDHYNRRNSNMPWYDEAIFYHIYPLGLTGAPKKNSYGDPEKRLMDLIPWISHIRELGCNALYIGPLFESVGHGYETTDYYKVDSRLGTNEDLKEFVEECHRQGIRVILDGVFNHTGRDFFAFKDIQQNREASPYKDWYCNVNFWGNNSYNDGFSYENWGGYDLLVKLNQKNPAVKDYINDVVRFWVDEFDIDGIRLDAADVLDFDFMKSLRHTANEVKDDFWLMGEVIHGDYPRWVNNETLHSVTNYQLHKALYSGHNDHNYFEIAHTVKRLHDMGANRPEGLKLYNFVDNHDVERIYTKLNKKEHFTPVHILMYTLPGIPSVYYGSEFGIEGRKERFSDDSIRPSLNLEDYKDALDTNEHTALIAALGKIRQNNKALSYGDYRELLLTNRQYAFSRSHDGQTVLVTVNNDDNDYQMNLPAGNTAEYIGALSGQKVSANNGNISVNVKANSGDIWVPYSEEAEEKTPVLKSIPANKKVKKEVKQSKKETETEKPKAVQPRKAEPVQKKVENPAPKPSSKKSEASEKEAFDKGVIAGLQQAVIALMEKHGPVTDQMRQDVYNNVYHDSLITWIKSFN